jgi:2-polyprenyl-3-methyl-5-hydroxy-6-metoxy-1,4-benzoquinol methylase
MRTGSDEALIRSNWRRYWSEHGHRIEKWDTVSETVLGTLERESGGVAGRYFLEAGCGTGRISLRLALNGARVTCLDVAQEALDLARAQFACGAEADFVLGSILAMPPGEPQDVVWNSGVLEHFHLPDRTLALRNFLKACREDGRVVIITPYDRCLPYRLAKWLLERTGRWPYGREIPLRTLAPAVPSEGRLLREYTISFLPLLLDAHKFVPALQPRSAAKIV